MTIESNVSKNTYIGNGQTTIFPFTYKIWQYDEVKVTLEDEKGITSNITPFSITINKNGGGEVVLYLDDENKTSIPTGYSIALTRNMPFKQEQDFLNGGRFNAEVIEDSFDMACAERQQLKEAVERTIQIPPTSATKPEELLNEIFSARNEAIDKAEVATLQAGIATEQANLSQSYAQSSNEQAVLSQEYAEEARAWAESDTAPGPNDPFSKSAKSWASYARDVWVELAKAWAESPVPPDPDDPGSKSAKEWAKIASDTVPLASHELAGKVKIGETVDVDGDGTIDISQNVLNNIERNGQNIAVLQAEKIDKSAISSALDSENVETVANSYALNELRKSVTALVTPGDKFIDIELKNNGSGLNQYSGSITVPAAGYVYLNFRIEAHATKGMAYAVVAVYRNGVQIIRYADRCEVVSGGYPSACAFGPVQKGDVCSFYKAFSNNSRQSDAFSRFYYAQGEI